MDLSVSQISLYLNKNFTGKDLKINGISSISNLEDLNISFVNKKNYKFNQSVKALIIAIEGYEIEENSKCSFIFSSNPRLDFVKIINKFFVNHKKSGISDTSKIGTGCKIAENVTIGEYVVIKDNVTIGSGTIIKNHVVVESNTIIGNNCYIKSGAIIGEDGFGFERDENGVPLRFLHIGSVIIGNNVEIGAKTTIARGTLESTIIKDNVKIDDQVHIAHNCIINRNTIITASSELSGSVIVGENCWIGPKTSIINACSIANNVFIGIGCNITSSIIDQNMKMANLGNLTFRNLIKIKKKLGIEK